MKARSSYHTRAHAERAARGAAYHHNGQPVNANMTGGNLTQAEAIALRMLKPRPPRAVRPPPTLRKFSWEGD